MGHYPTNHDLQGGPAHGPLFKLVIFSIWWHERGFLQYVQYVVRSKAGVLYTSPAWSICDGHLPVLPNGYHRSEMYL